MPRAAKVLTISSTAADGTRADRSGPAVAEALERLGFSVALRRVVPDGIEPVATAVAEMAERFTGLVATTGGTGFSPTDLTPEATLSVLEREARGIPELMRAASPLGPLSRGVAGTIGACLVVNLPGSPVGAVESLDAIAGLLEHALELLGGGRPH